MLRTQIRQVFATVTRPVFPASPPLHAHGQGAPLTARSGRSERETGTDAGSHRSARVSRYGSPHTLSTTSGTSRARRSGRPGLDATPTISSILASASPRLTAGAQLQYSD